MLRVGVLLVRVLRVRVLIVRVPEDIDTQSISTHNENTKDRDTQSRSTLRESYTQRKLYSEYSYWRILLEQARARERRGARATRGSLRGLFLPHQEQVLRRGEVMGSQLRFDPSFFGLALRAAAEADAFLFLLIKICRSRDALPGRGYV